MNGLSQPLAETPEQGAVWAQSTVAILEKPLVRFMRSELRLRQATPSEDRLAVPVASFPRFPEPARLLVN